MSRLAAAALLAAVLASASAAAPAATGTEAWCKAASSAAWRRVLASHIVALTKKMPMIPLALANDGRSFFAEVHSQRFSGIARIDAKTSALTEIKAFLAPKFAQAWGSFDGRWLVWNEYHGYDSFNNFTVWAWDTRARKLTQLGAATQGPDGQFWESPWRGADVRDGIATWVQGDGPDQLGEVHAYDLRTDHDLVIRHGHPGGAFLLNHHIVIWPEASLRGAPTRMRAASALTGGHLEVPRALRGLRNVTGLYTDGQRFAYPNGPYRSLWWSPSLREDPFEVVATHHFFNHIDNSVQIWGRYVGFGIQPHVFVADTKAGRYIEVSDHLGSVFVDSRALLVVYGTTKKVLHPVLRMAYVPLRDLPAMPACA